MVALIAQPAAAEDVHAIAWPDLRDSDDPICEAEHAFSRSFEACQSPERSIDFLRCGTATRDHGPEPVRIAGYAHPLTLEFRGVTTFFLSPPQQRCKHAPPPMGNQIILVESAVPLDIGFDPVFVTGTIEPTLILEGFTQVRYRMHVTDITPATHPDVRP